MIAELITEENLIIVLSHLNNIMFYMTIIVWVLFFFHLTNYMGCGMLHSENPIGFNSQMLVCAIFLTIGCIGLSWILGCLVETIKNMSMCLICVFVIACPILGFIIRELEFSITSIFFGLPSIILFLILYFCNIVDFKLSVYLPQIIRILGVCAAAYLIPIAMIRIYVAIEDYFDDKHRKRQEDEEKRKFKQFISENNLVISSLNPETRTTEIENLKKMSGSFLIKKKNSRNEYKLGPQIDNYLRNYGHIASKNTIFLGIGEDVDSEHGIISQTKKLRDREKNERLKDFFVVERLRDGRYAVVRSWDDSVFYYETKTKKFHQCDQSKNNDWLFGYTKLYDYIKMRVQEETKVLTKKCKQ